MKPRGRQETRLFWYGLAGILATAYLVFIGLGGVQDWIVAGLLSFTKWGHPIGVVGLVVPVLLVEFDLVAVGMIVAGGVVFSRRLRERAMTKPVWAPPL